MGGAAAAGTPEVTLSRGAIAVLAIAALVVAAVVALAAGMFGGGDEGGLPPSRALAARTSVAPTAGLFGDLVTAHAEVIVDGRRVNADGVRIEADFAPFALARPPLHTTTSSGDVVSLTYHFELLCLTSECVAAGDSKLLALPEARVLAPLRNGRTAELELVWPPVNIGRRIPESESSAAASPRWRLQTELPAVTYRWNPTRFANLLALVSALLAAAGVALAGWELERFRRRRRHMVEARSLLSTTLDLVRQSTARGADDRRKALALLARVLARERVNGQLAGSATQLAWSRPEPSPAGVEALADEVERETEEP